MPTITAIFGCGANKYSEEFELTSTEARQILKNHIYEHVEANDDADKALVNAIFLKKTEI